MSEKPKLLALIFCASADYSPATATLSLFNLTSVAFPASLPMPMEKVCLFLHLKTSVKADIAIRLVTQGTANTIWRHELQEGPNQADGTLTAIVEIDRILFTEYGSYDFEVYVDGVYVDSRTFRIMRAT